MHSVFFPVYKTDKIIKRLNQLSRRKHLIALNFHFHTKNTGQNSLIKLVLEKAEKKYSADVSKFSQHFYRYLVKCQDIQKFFTHEGSSHMNL